MQPRNQGYPLDICEIPTGENEERTLKFWSEEQIFKKSVEKNPEEAPYILYDGPPFATGNPHYGHALAHIIKDVIPRFQTMNGKRVERRFGWDCHGVPVENQVEKENKITGVTAIEKMGISKFNEHCRSIVQRCTEEWRWFEERIGRFVDMDNDYKTMEPWFMESVWAVFCKLNEKGLIYQGKKVVAYSPALGTPLSDFEAKLNYKKIDDPAITMAFPLVEDEDTALLVWTTTPWSVPTNVAIAINMHIEYVKVHTPHGKKFILAKARVSDFFSSDDCSTIETIDPQTLLDQIYIPMFDPVPGVTTNCYQIFSSDHVTVETGTGLVHISPAHGEDDFSIGERHGLPATDFIDRSGIFSQGIPGHPELAGNFFKNVDAPLIAVMKRKQRLFKQATLEHEYPFCWRTDTPLIYRAVPSWFVEVTRIKDQLVATNKKIAWYPSHIGEKRFGNWLQSARDWAISRNRYWGTPIPIWVNVEDPTDKIFISSIKQLEELVGEKIADLHREHIDHLVIKRDGKEYKRIEEVFDCWFESGSMPYAQNGYAFDDDEEFFRSKFPADFIAEGADQTRGWFYTLHVLATALFDKPAFKNCVVNGILLGNDGKKMSKSKGNFPDMKEVLTKYGADALRFFLMSSSATCAQEAAVDEKQIENATKEVLLPWLNIYKFFATYANLKGFRYDGQSPDPASLLSPMDQWLMYRTELFKEKITRHYNDYNLMLACQEVKAFISDLSKWYIHYRRNVLSSKSASLTKAQQQSFQCLAHALSTLNLCAAPITPFISEYIHQAIYGRRISVHLQTWPSPIVVKQCQSSFADMDLIQQIVSLGLRVRDDKEIRLRQPLSAVYLDERHKNRLEPHADFIKQALNVKQIIWERDTSELVQQIVVLNLKALGQKYRSELPSIRDALAEGDYQLQNDKLLIAGKELLSEEFSIRLKPKEGKAGHFSEDRWVVFNIDLDKALLEEGKLRDFIRQLQALRKKAKFSPGQIVDVSLSVEFSEIVSGNEKLILDETNCKIDFNQGNSSAFNVEFHGIQGSIHMKLSETQPTFVNSTSAAARAGLTLVRPTTPVVSTDEEPEERRVFTTTLH